MWDGWGRRRLAAVPAPGGGDAGPAPGGGHIAEELPFWWPQGTQGQYQQMLERPTRRRRRGRRGQEAPLSTEEFRALRDQVEARRRGRLSRQAETRGGHQGTGGRLEEGRGAATVDGSHEGEDADQWGREGADGDQWGREEGWTGRMP